MTKPDLYSFNIDAIKALRQDSTTAWIEPDGRLQVVPLFKHLTYFLDNPDVIPEATETLSRFVTEHGKLSITGRHMAQVMDRIYAHGWGRVGTYGGDKLELDCDGAHMDDLRRKAKAIARMLNRGLVCRVAKPFQKRGQKHAPMARDAVWSSLREGFVGWLSPDGDIFETPPDAPFSTFVDDPDRVPELAKTFEDAVAEDKNRQSDEFQQEFIEANPDEGHMPWHYFWHRPYSPADEEKATMTSVVLSRGWGRLSVEVEGTVILEADEGRLDELATVLGEAIGPTGSSVDARPFDASVQGGALDFN